VITFDTLQLSPDSYWNGADLSGGFRCGEAFFPNFFVDWGGGYTSWGAFAYSNKTDTITSGYLNQYSAYAGSGFGHSANFCIGYYDWTNGLYLTLSDVVKGDTVAGFYITNNTYSALCMKHGDGFSKKFTGADQDWFLLTIFGYRNGLKKPDSVNFYLADFRFPDTTRNYIVKDWRWVDLNKLGGIDSIRFEFTSTDNDTSSGMKTPAYFCMDNLTIKHQYHTGVNDTENSGKIISVYPNPADVHIHPGLIDDIRKIIITDISGKIIYSSDHFEPEINIDSWERGLYFMNIVTATKILSTRFLKID